MSHVLAPWHLWGTTQVANPVVSAIPDPNNTTTSQLARINYGRPETWSFFFAALILNTEAIGISVINVQVLFDLTIGIGRSSYTAQNFAGFVFNGNGAALAGAKKWTSVVLAPELNDPTPSFRPELASFPAEDIQCNARIAAFQGGGGAAVGQSLGLEVTSYFAPRTHIRPEWLTWDEGNETRYRGREQGGS